MWITLTVFFALTSIALFCWLVGSWAITQANLAENERFAEENEKVKADVAKERQELEALKSRLEMENNHIKSQYMLLQSHQARQLAKWNELIETSKPLRTMAELDVKVAKILLDANQETDRIRKEAESQASKTRDSADTDARRIRNEASKILADAKNEYSIAVRNANQEARQIIAEARNEYDTANQKARLIRKDAEDYARERERKTRIAVENLTNDKKRLNEEKQSLTHVIEAMHNTVNGYSDKYIIPSTDLLDGLVDSFGYSKAGAKLKDARKRSREIAKNGNAATSTFVDQSRREQAIQLIVDAFNAKLEAIFCGVKTDNYGKLKQKIKDAYTMINENSRMFQTLITTVYRDARIEELKWACATLEIKRREQEEQREIREQMREENKARKELEKVQRETEAEEERIRSELEREQSLQIAVRNATAEERERQQAKINELRRKLIEAEEKSQRAKSNAESTKCGTVYIISNIGSFGENVIKIGMTRRDDPNERVLELSRASVPFRFDIHAFIPSTDAPALETALHKHFALQQINKVNHRKEFFRVTPSEVRAAIDSLGIQGIEWTMKAEASEYRETLQVEKSIKDNPMVRKEWLDKQELLDKKDLNFYST